MQKNSFKFILIFLKFLLCASQKTAYNETCNSTEECSDHRYECQSDEENVLRCLCDRFHVWDDTLGCVQIYNATEILNMTVTVTDNIRYLEDSVNFIIKTQIAAGFFVLGMVIVGTITVTTFCLYVHITDRSFAKKTAAVKKQRMLSTAFQTRAEPQPSTSAVV